MPKVPVYGGPSVDPRPLPTPRTDSVVTPELLSGEARQSAQLGDALMRSGKAGMDVLGDMRERETADTVFRAESGLKEDFISFEQEMREKRQGRFAKNLTDDSKKWWDERIQKRSEELQNPNARRLFAQRAAGLRMQGLDSASRWEAVQLEKSHDEAWVADKKAEISLAAANPTPENIDKARRELDRLNRYQAARKGSEGAKLKADILADTTDLHKQVIGTLALNDPTGAQEYFNKWKHEIDGTQHAEIGKFAKNVSANSIGTQVAGALWAKGGPKADADPVNLDELEKEARKALEKNQPALKAALADLKERTINFDKGVREREAANASAVSQAAMKGVSLTEIKRMPEFQKLSGTKQAAMEEHIENVRYTRAQRGRQATEQADQDLARKNAAAYLKYSDPEALRTMSRNEVLALLPELGRTYTEHLAKSWDSLTKSDAKVHEAKMDADDFNQVAQGVGLSPFDPKKNEKERAQLGKLKYAIEQRIDQEQQKKKAPLTRAEKMIFMQQEMDNQVLVDRTLWFDASKPVILLTPDEVKKAYVMVDGQEVKLSSIPAEDRANIIKARQARRLPVTEQLIAQTWVRSKQKKTPKAPTVADANRSVPY